MPQGHAALVRQLRTLEVRELAETEWDQIDRSLARLEQAQADADDQNVQQELRLISTLSSRRYSDPSAKLGRPDPRAISPTTQTLVNRIIDRIVPPPAEPNPADDKRN